MYIGQKVDVSRSSRNLTSPLTGTYTLGVAVTTHGAFTLYWAYVIVGWILVMKEYRDAAGHLNPWNQPGSLLYFLIIIGNNLLPVLFSGHHHIMVISNLILFWTLVGTYSGIRSGKAIDGGLFWGVGVWLALFVVGIVWWHQGPAIHQAGWWLTVSVVAFLPNMAFTMSKTVEKGGH